MVVWHRLFLYFGETYGRVSEHPKVRQVTGSSVVARADTDRCLLADLRGHGEQHAILDVVIIVVCPLPLCLISCLLPLLS